MNQDQLTKAESGVGSAPRGQTRAIAPAPAAATLLGLPLIAIIVHTTVRIIRHFYKFPMPEFVANLIDNPVRRRLQPPDKAARRHALEPGMQVLEVGPGNGPYSVAAARRLGDCGRIVAIDIEPKMIESVQRRVQVEALANVEAQVADVYDLPFC